MSGLDKAAQAFEVDINGSANGDNGTGGVEETIAVESMFDREHEDDEVAGGDGEPDPVVAKEPVADVEDEDEDLDPDGEEDPDAEEDEDEDPEDDDEETDEKSVGFEAQEFDVIVDGKPVKVTGKEMQEGYIRTETFHQRLNKLAEAQEVMRREASVLYENRKTYVEKLDEAEAIIKSLVPEQPNWDELYEQDPKKANALRKSFEQIEAKLVEIRTKREEAVREDTDTRSKNYQEWVQRENQRVLSANPAWSDPQKGQERMQRDLESMAQTARAAGFSDDEIRNTHDSRMISILQKAAAYDRIKSKQVKPVKRGKTPVSNGAGSKGTAPKGVNRAMGRLRKTGKVDDAAAVFGEIISGRR